MNAKTDTRYLLAVVEQRFTYFDCKARGPVQTVPGCIGWRAFVRVECDVGPCGRRRRPRFRRGARRARICKESKQKPNYTPVHHNSWRTQCAPLSKLIATQQTTSKNSNIFLSRKHFLFRTIKILLPN